jgi:hypothetical protein
MRASQPAFQANEDVEEEGATGDEETDVEDVDGDEDDEEAYGGLVVGDEIEAEIGDEEEDTCDVYDMEVSFNDPLAMQGTETPPGRFKPASVSLCK